MPLTANCIYNAITTGERLSGLTRKFGPPGFDSAIEKAYPEEPKGALPPITRAHFQEPRRLPSYFALFETLSLYARRAYYTGSKTRPKNMEKVEASAVRQAIIAFIHQEENLASCEVRLDAEDANSPDNLMDVRLKRRKPYALKLVGYHIDGDLDLSNLNFKGSIRLIGCVVTGALILDRCELITLDLSGSVIKHGISGMYLSLRGALRCRRLVSESAIDFGGLSALGTVDFTDAVISPENDTSTRASYVRDRGILNLAQSDLKRDLRMERARIYGGINLRAAHIGGMFHLNDALLRSPLAHFEYILLKTLTLIAQKGNEGLLNEAGSLEAAKKHPSWVQLSPTFPQSLSHGAVEAIAAQLHPDAIDKKRDPLWISKEDHGDLHAATERRKWERLGGSFKNETAIGDGSRLQEYLMSGDLATAEAALRAEQLKVEGPIYARGLRTSGRIRLKHLIANGNLSLNGSRLRSAKDIGIGLWFLRKMLRTEKEILESSGEHKEAMGVVKCVKGLPKRHHARLKRSYRTSLKLLSENEEKWLISPEANDKDRLSDYVIDLDHARIKGDVDFSYDTRINRTVQKHEEAFKDALKSISDELLKFYRHKDEASARESLSLWFKNPKSGQIKGYEPFSTKNLPRHLRESPEQVRYNPALIIGDVKLDNIVTQGSVYFRGTIFNPYKDYRVTKRKSIRARNADIRLHVDIRESVGLNGLCLTSARVGGSVRCYDLHLDGKGPDGSLMSSMAFCHPVFLERHPSKTSKGKVFVEFDLSLAKIGGSAFLAFHPECGPSILFDEGQVENQTYIFSPDQVLAARKPREQKDDDRSKSKRLKDDLIEVFRFFFPKISLSLLGEKKNTTFNRRVSREDPAAYPVISLRGLSSPFLSHNPGAWPMPGFLNIRNVRYEATDDNGHLYPLARTLDSTRLEQERNKKIHDQYRPVLWAAVLGVAAVCAGILWLAHYQSETCYSGGWNHPGDLECFLSDVLGGAGRWVRVFGGLNIVLMVVFFAVVKVLGSWSKSVFPRERRAKPLAIFWLNLQREHLNTRRTKHYILPTEPYIRAASVLRAANRNTSAASVELDRLRKRRKALSLFKAFPSRALLKMFDFFMGYGLKPSRGVMITVFYLLVASLVFHGAKTNGVIVPSDVVDLYEERKVLGFNNSRVVGGEVGKDESAFQDSRRQSGGALDLSQGERHNLVDIGDDQSCLAVLDRLSKSKFHSLLFTLDSLVPFIDMDIEKDWKVVEPDRFSTILNCEDNEHTENGKLYSSVYLLAVLIKILGWCLITALAFSLLTRFESLLIRSNS